MTGFGAAEGAVAGGRLRFEIRTVNHRHFNLATKLPGGAGGARGRAARAAAPGVRSRPRGGAGALDRVPGASHAASRWTWSGRGWSPRGCASCRAALGLGGRGDAGAGRPAARRALVGRERRGRRSPGARSSRSSPRPPPSAGRCARGKARRWPPSCGTGSICSRASAERIAARAPERLVRERDRLRAAVAELLDGRPVDEARLAQEIAFQADRLDITEELVRFRAHLGAARERARRATSRPASSSASWRRSWAGKSTRWARRRTTRRSPTRSSP